MTQTHQHPAAVVHANAQIGAGCEIGPFCVVGEHVVLGAGCRLHSHVVVDGYTRLGRDNELFPFACIGLKTQDLKWGGGTTFTEIGDGGVTRVGSHNHILAYCHIAHDCQLGDHIVMSNVATLAGHVVVEDHAVVGGLVAVHQFCRIGRMAMIGGCSKVVQDVPPFMLADGSPAETKTINKVGLERHALSEETQAALRQAYKILFREGLTIPNALTRIESELPALPEVKYLVQFVRASERGISK